MKFRGPMGRGEIPLAINLGVTVTKQCKHQCKNPHKHMKPGIPCHEAKVTKQARIIIDFSEDRIYILHGFTKNNEYEQWYNSYK